MKQIIAAMMCAGISFSAYSANHVLDGRTLTVDQLWQIAQPGETVSISDDGMSKFLSPKD